MQHPLTRGQRVSPCPRHAEPALAIAPCAVMPAAARQLSAVTSPGRWLTMPVPLATQPPARRPAGRAPTRRPPDHGPRRPFRSAGLRQPSLPASRYSGGDAATVTPSLPPARQDGWPGTGNCTSGQARGSLAPAVGVSRRPRSCPAGAHRQGRLRTRTPACTSGPRRAQSARLSVFQV